MINGNRQVFFWMTSRLEQDTSAALPYTRAMETGDLRECTQAADRPAWHGVLELAPGQPPRFVLAAAGPGLRHLCWPGHQALVAGQPRPEQAPPTQEADPDPAFELLQTFERSGLSALRRVEGPWALLRWDQEAGALLLAVDRLAREPVFQARTAQGWVFGSDADRLAALHGWSADAARLERCASGYALPQGQTAYCEINCLAPGCHVQLRSDGSEHPGVHGNWRLEKRERRAPVLVAGEFIERLKSVLRVQGEQAQLLLLAERPVETALVAAALSALPGPLASLLYVPGVAAAPHEVWSLLAQHFGLAMVAAQPDADSDGGSAAAARVGAQDAALLAGTPGLPVLTSLLAGLARRVTAGERPLLLLSTRGFDTALPVRPLPALSAAAWRVARAEPPPPVAQIGAQLADCFSRHWQPPLLAVAHASGVSTGWPMLDETVAHFLANLPLSMRLGRPWTRDLRRRLLADLLPVAVRRLRTASGAPLFR